VDLKLDHFPLYKWYSRKLKESYSGDKSIALDAKAKLMLFKGALLIVVIEALYLVIGISFWIISKVF
jgi:hypothetical protein